MVREIEIFELIGRLQALEPDRTLRIANIHDYDTYSMCYSKQDEDVKNETYHIGYPYDDRIEGKMFSVVCRVEKGKITRLSFDLDENTINLGKLYIDNMEGKNIIVNTAKKLSELPY